MNARSARLGVAAAASLVVLTGCGSSDSGGGPGGGGSFADESPNDIENAATADMKALKSLHMQGEVSTDGQQVSLDLSLTDAGDCQGTIGIDDGRAEIVSLDGQAWFKPDEAFWRVTAGEQADQVIAVVGDKWVVQPPDTESFDSFCNLNTLLEELGGDTGEDDSTKAEDTEEVDGQEAVVLTSKTDDGDPARAWVSVDDPHHILQIETEGEEPGTLRLSDFDEDVEIEAPPEKDTIDLSQAPG